jgi:YfiH family protein
MTTSPLELLLWRCGRICYGITLSNYGRWTARGWTLHQADDVSDDQVQQCRVALAETLGFAPSTLVLARQVHGTTIADISSIEDITSPITADALVTCTPGLLLCISLADCCDVLIWGSDTPCVAAVHAGWRGTAAGIAGTCVGHLATTYQVDPSRLNAWLSPCASAQNYIVRDDVAALFPGFVRRIDSEQYLLDLQSAVIEQLVRAGMSRDRIACAQVCTIADRRFHSYRRDGARSGRMAAFIGISE